MTSQDRRWVAAGGALMVVGLLCGGVMALTAGSFSKLGSNSLFDACGVAILLGLGVMVSAVAIDGLVDRRHVSVVPLDQSTDGQAPGTTEARLGAPVLEVQRLFVNQHRSGAYRARYELTIHADDTVKRLRVEARAPSITHLSMTGDTPLHGCDAGEGAHVAWSTTTNPPKRLHLDVWTAEPEERIEIFGSIA